MPIDEERLRGRIGAFHNGCFYTWTTVSSACGTCIALGLFLLVVVVMSVLPLAMIFIGGLNLNNCPVQKYIPIYLIVQGVFSLMWINYSAIKNIRKIQAGKTTNERGNQKSTIGSTIHCLISLFGFLWFVAGNIWVFKAYKPSYNSKDTGYCDKLTYNFAFWSIVLTYVIPLSLCCCCCCIGCIGIAAAATDDEITMETNTTNTDGDNNDGDKNEKQNEDPGPEHNESKTSHDSNIYPDLSDEKN